MTEIEIPLATTTIAGMQFRGQAAKEELQMIEPNTLLILAPEPTNKYDPNAIRIISPYRAVDGNDPMITGGGVFLGYVPRRVCPLVLQYMQAPNRVECRLMEKGTDLVNIIGFEPATAIRNLGDPWGDSSQ